MPIKAISILPHEAKPLLELFCLLFSAQGTTAPVVILLHETKYLISYIGGSGLDQTDDFQKFCGSGLDRIQFYRIRIGLTVKNLSVSYLWCIEAGVSEWTPAGVLMNMENRSGAGVDFFKEKPEPEWIRSHI